MSGTQFAAMISTFLWGWSNTKRTTPLRRTLVDIQCDKRYRMPKICETPNQAFPLLTAHIETQIHQAKGKPNVQVIVIHPNLLSIKVDIVRECCTNLLYTASFCSKTFVVFCDLTGSFPDNGDTVTKPHQLNSELRKLSTQWPLHSLYLDLHQIIQNKDWTNKLNLRASAQVRLGQAIVRTLKGTPSELFKFG